MRQEESSWQCSAFSAAALSHVQCSADCLPQEQVACEAGVVGRLRVSYAMLYYAVVMILVRTGSESISKLTTDTRAAGVLAAASRRWLLDDVGHFDLLLM